MRFIEKATGREWDEFDVDQRYQRECLKCETRLSRREWKMLWFEPVKEVPNPPIHFMEERCNSAACGRVRTARAVQCCDWSLVTCPECLKRKPEEKKCEHNEPGFLFRCRELASGKVVVDCPKCGVAVVHFAEHPSAPAYDAKGVAPFGTHYSDQSTDPPTVYIADGKGNWVKDAPVDDAALVEEKPRVFHLNKDGKKRTITVPFEICGTSKDLTWLARQIENKGISYGWVEVGGETAVIPNSKPEEWGTFLSTSTRRRSEVWVSKIDGTIFACESVLRNSWKESFLPLIDTSFEEWMDRLFVRKVVEWVE